MPKKPASGPSKPKAPARRRIPKIKPPTFSWRTHDLTAVDTGGNDSLIAELVTYQKNLDLLLEHKGEYVVIKGNEIVGYYPDQDSAAYDAAVRFGTEPALIKEIVEFERYDTCGQYF